MNDADVERVRRRWRLQCALSDELNDSLPPRVSDEELLRRQQKASARIVHLHWWLGIEKQDAERHAKALSDAEETERYEDAEYCRCCGAEL